MVQIIKSNVTTETVQGEITINLNLTITINQDGSVAVGVAQEKKKLLTETPEIPDTRFIIPDFEGSSELLPDFGEDVGR